MTDGKYWQDVEKKNLDQEELKNEFVDGELQFEVGNASKSRRDFLKLMGFSFSAVSMSSCIKIPVKKAIPYLTKNETTVPGVAKWYATALDPRLGEALVVKTREGRPIKIEGNELSSCTKGGTSVYSQASILSLYDSSRFKEPQIEGKNSSWQEIDRALEGALSEAEQSGKEIHFYTAPVSSPSLLAIIEKLKKKYSKFEHIVFDMSGLSSLLKANQEVYGCNFLPSYSLENADLVLSFGADFLGTWLAPVQFTKEYSVRKDLAVSNSIIRHIQIEEKLSLTGSNADMRFTRSLNEQNALLLGVLSGLQRKLQKQLLPIGQRLPEFDVALADKLVNELINFQGRSLVLCGHSNPNGQIIVMAINEILGNYGKTVINYENDFYAGAIDAKVVDSIKAMDKGLVAAVFFNDVNPQHFYPDQKYFASSLAKVPLRVAYSTFPDETTVLCNYVMPTNYYLETWGDFYCAKGELQFVQPVIQPLFSTRMLGESLLKLLGETNYPEFQKKYLGDNFFERQSRFISRNDFWNQGLHDGVIAVTPRLKKNASFSTAAVSLAFGKIVKDSLTDSSLSMVIYQKVTIRTGELVNNPWLQETPDPITKATWDNYILINPTFGRELGLRSGSFIKVSFGENHLELPVILQPGMEKKTIAVAMGYGRTVSGKVGKSIGANIASFITFKDGVFNLMSEGIKISKLDKYKEMALTQTHHSMEGRDIVRESTLKEFIKNPKAGSKASVKLISMWGGHDKSGEQWAMVIDLNKCTGCSGCIVSCNAENNVPVVGREEVLLRREMHWIRIDRYYKGDEDNPEVVHQPMMCQHCDNAPCETVCPVMATVQSSDGLNQQVYNRCVGTRYCANNCPYKVRRFNWFDYPHDDKYENMVLNPDVTVRSRGVMEKCSMCIQRIQEAKLDAKKKGEVAKDGDIKLACQQSCPADAIVFGNLNDPESKLVKLLTQPRNYRVLEEINVLPRVSYLTKIRNKD